MTPRSVGPKRIHYLEAITEACWIAMTVKTANVMRTMPINMLWSDSIVGSITSKPWSLYAMIMLSVIATNLTRVSMNTVIDFVNETNRLIITPKTTMISPSNLRIGAQEKYMHPALCCIYK